MFLDLTRDVAIQRMPFLLALTADRLDWPPWTEQQFLANRWDKWVLSFMDDTGVAILSRIAEDHVHLHLLAIHPDLRGRGNGTRFMREIDRRVGAQRFTFKVPGDSEDTVRFYLRHGFQFSERWRPMERKADERIGC